MAKQMKAAFYNDFGDLTNLKFGTVERPEAGEGEVVVRIKAAGVNPVDAGIIGGHLEGRMPHKFPIIPGWDMAGVVEERGFSARRFNTGEKIYGYARRPFIQWGTFAEYVVIPESYLSDKPENISFEQAGAIPLAGLTAYQSIYDAGNLQEGQTLLILGASGGVGSFAIQLGKIKGAKVIGVASEKNHEFMKELGADEVVDYEDTDIGRAVRDIEPEGVDLIFDAASGETLQQSLPALTNDGKLVSILNQGDDLDPNIDFQYVFVEPHSAELDHLCELIEKGDIEVHVSSIYGLDEAADALQQIQTGHTTGKIVITP